MRNLRKLDPMFGRLLAPTLGNGAASAAINGRSGTGAPDRNRLVSAILHLAPGSSLAEIAGRPVSWLGERLCIAEISPNSLHALLKSPEVIYIEAPRVMTPALNKSVPLIKANPPVAGRNNGRLTGKGVVIGIIDWGFDFTSRDFITDAGESRILYLWDQNLVPKTWETAPAGASYGIEYSQQDINRANRAPDPFAVVRHASPPGSHGTHVMGIAAGNGRQACSQFPAGDYVGVAKDADLILVHPRVTGESVTDSRYVADAINYIFAKAGPRPCVINMSLGQNGGAHDGSSLVEHVIEENLRVPGRAVVAACGNERGNRIHTSGTVPAGSTQSFGWQIPNGNRINQPIGAKVRDVDILMIHYSSRDSFAVRLCLPNGSFTDWVLPGEISDDYVNGKRISVFSSRFNARNGESEIGVSVEFIPERDAGRLEDWTVELRGDAVRNGRFQAWIERTGLNCTYGQSMIAAADADKTNTITTPGTSPHAVTVANLHPINGDIAGSSGEGPIRTDSPKPDLAAPGVDIFSSNSGCRAGGPSRIPMSGTSMAAPHVTGAVALMLQEDPVLTNSQIRKILIAATDPLAAADHSTTSGYGRLNVATLVNLI